MINNSYFNNEIYLAVEDINNLLPIIQERRIKIIFDLENTRITQIFSPIISNMVIGFEQIKSSMKENKINDNDFNDKFLLGHKCETTKNMDEITHITYVCDNIVKAYEKISLLIKKIIVAINELKEYVNLIINVLKETITDDLTDFYSEINLIHKKMYDCIHKDFHLFDHEDMCLNTILSSLKYTCKEKTLLSLKILLNNSKVTKINIQTLIKNTNDQNQFFWRNKYSDIYVENNKKKLLEIELKINTIGKTIKKIKEIK